MGIVFGFLLVAHPEKFSGVTQTQQDTMPRGVSERKGARIAISKIFKEKNIISEKFTLELILCFRLDNIFWNLPL